ncbi:hypothetical protein ARMSODRAFT_604082 [Armillaria solidipes]|uniref:Uncharacterized protein n=1 Tax=Armillaria solidipes TaxID=1076256 RepID=A0A2H3BDD6_9AGAR|nr:hypothetical protein ARMSODRAFT_604082 [Armillaria solidipes]
MVLTVEWFAGRRKRLIEAVVRNSCPLVLVLLPARRESLSLTAKKLVQERSRQLPLHLDVSAWCSPPNLFLNIPRLQYHGLDSLFYGEGTLHLRRLKSLSLHFSTNSGTLSLQHNHSEFPELEHLKLYGVFDASDPDEPPIDLFAHAPKLHTVFPILYMSACQTNRSQPSIIPIIDHGTSALRSVKDSLTLRQLPFIVVVWIYSTQTTFLSASYSSKI